ncbi:MAG: hypothetical protein KatS3mg068_2205 [Candidatus Sericytochromatia bacterium]|nr:MAG: hypothetical protein KatS3mg068_2205 [Candidatus Sericytochromatia bacterium]
MDTLESIYGILFKTESTIYEVKKTNNFYKTILILLIVSFINALYISNSFLASIITTLTIFISIIFLGLFLSMFIALGSNFLGGNASIKDTLEIFIYSTLPFIFFPIFSLFFISKLFLFIWFFIIFSIGLKVLNNFSITKAIVSIFFYIRYFISNKLFTFSYYYLIFNS